MIERLQSIIDTAWDNRGDINAETGGDVRDAVDTAIAMLDSGQTAYAFLALSGEA